MNIKISVFSALLLFFCIHSIYAQEKIERESRISSDKVPAESVEYISSLQVKGKVKWYLEENLKGTYYEAKFKKDKIHYSIKFEASGKLYDVEEIFKYSKANFQAKQQIEKTLDEKYKNWKIKKAQLNWIGGPEILKQYVIDRKSPEGIKPNFELVVRGKKPGDVGYYEYLFTIEGKLIAEIRIAQDNLNNLIF